MKSWFSSHQMCGEKKYYGNPIDNKPSTNKNGGPKLALKGKKDRSLIMLKNQKIIFFSKFIRLYPQDPISPTL